MIIFHIEDKKKRQLFLPLRNHNYIELLVSETAKSLFFLQVSASSVASPAHKARQVSEFTSIHKNCLKQSKRSRKNLVHLKH